MTLVLISTVIAAVPRLTPVNFGDAVVVAAGVAFAENWFAAAN
jgi:hypothetical protein